MDNFLISRLNSVIQDYEEKKSPYSISSKNNLNIDELNQSEIKNNNSSFLDVLKSSMNEVNEQQVQADVAIKEMVSGNNKNIHETMLMVERADTSLKLMMQIRNKILEAYKEIIKMQV